MKRCLVLLVAVVLVAAGCRGGAEHDSGRLRIVASFYPLAEIAQRIGGHDVEVTNLTPAGIEPHDLELTSHDVDRLEDADVVLYLGDDFQRSVAATIDTGDPTRLDLLGDLPRGPVDDEDPHFWLDPTLMRRAVDRVEALLSHELPNRAAEFATRARRFDARLEALDRDYRSGLRDCARNELVTAHAAFHYLAARYDLVQLPVTGLSPEAEPEPNRLADLADLIRSHGVTTVFAEDLLPADLAEALARESDVDIEVLNPLEGLTAQQLAAGDDYESVMRINLARLRTALGCR